MKTLRLEENITEKQSLLFLHKILFLDKNPYLKQSQIWVQQKKDPFRFRIKPFPVLWENYDIFIKHGNLTIFY